MKKLSFLAITIVCVLSLESCGSLRGSDCGLAQKNDINKNTIVTTNQVAIESEQNS